MPLISVKKPGVGLKGRSRGDPARGTVLFHGFDVGVVLTLKRPSNEDRPRF